MRCCKRTSRPGWLISSRIEPLMAAVRNGDQAGFTNQLAVVAKLDRQYEIALDKVLALHETYAKQLNVTAQQNFNFSVLMLVILPCFFSLLSA